MSNVGGYSPTMEGDLRLWLDASLPGSMTITGAQQVTAWYSRVRGVSMVRGVTGPNYSATGWDGVHPCVIFNPTATYTDLRANSIAGLTNFLGDTSPATLIFRALSPTGTIGYLFQSYSSGGGYAALEGIPTFPKIDIYWSSGGSHAGGVVSYATNTSFTHSTVISSTNLATYKNGSGADIPSTAFAPATVSDFSICGGALLGNQGLNIKIASVLLYKSTLSTSALDRVHNYLATRWP